MKRVAVEDQEAEPAPRVRELGFSDHKADEEQACRGWRENRLRGRQGRGKERRRIETGTHSLIGSFIHQFLASPTHHIYRGINRVRRLDVGRNRGHAVCHCDSRRQRKVVYEPKNCKRALELDGEEDDDGEDQGDDDGDSLKTKRREKGMSVYLDSWLYVSLSLSSPCYPYLLLENLEHQIVYDSIAAIVLLSIK